MLTLFVKEIRNQLNRLGKFLGREQDSILTSDDTLLAGIAPVKDGTTKPDHKSLRDGLPYQDIVTEFLQRMDREER